MQKISPFLWFGDNAEEAVDFYVSVFKDAKILETSRYGDSFPEMAGKALVVSFELFGQGFMALNGGQEFPFNHAVSFMVHCEDQAEVDYYWSKLTADGGEESRCGWLKDKFGLSWQIIPKGLSECIQDPDPAKAKRAMEAMMAMGKIDIAALKAARDG